MGLLKKLQEERFWESWEERFQNNYDRYITPDEPNVKAFYSGLSVPNGASNYKIAEEAWVYTKGKIEYELSEKWKTPKETVLDGIGDCEDMVFLIGSMLPNLGVGEFDVVIGEVSDGEVDEYHVWLVVGGDIIDPTATPELENKLIYKEQQRFRVKVKQ